jgi:neutral trehalase
LSAVLIGIYKLLQQHQQYSKIQTDYEEEFESYLTDPEEGEYTDYDTAMSTHRVRKGSIDPKQKAFGLLFRI